MRGQRGSRKKLDELRRYLAAKELQRQKVQEIKRKEQKLKKIFMLAAGGVLAAAGICYMLWEVL